MIKKILFIGFIVSTVLSAQQIYDESNQYLLAQSYIQAAQYQKALPIMESLYKSQPSNYEYFNALNNVYTQLKDYDASIALIEDRMKISNADINLYGMLGSTYYLKGNDKKAFEVWDNALKTLPQSEVNYRVIANYAIERRTFDKAIEYLKKGQNISSNPIYFAYDLGNLYSLTMQYKDATEEYCFILSINPTQLSTVEGRILTYINKPGALAVSLPVVEKYTNSENLNYKFLLARLYIEDKSYDKAYKIYKEIEDVQKDQGAQLLNFAQFLYGEKVYQTSASVYSDIIKNFPESPFVSNAKLGYAKTLEAVLDAETSDNKQTWKPYYNLAYNNSPEVNKVIAAYVEITKLYPHSEVANEAYLRIGEIKMNRQGNIKDAESYFNRIIEDSPMSQYASAAYEDLGKSALLQGDLNSAFSYFSKIALNGRYPADKRNYANYQLARINFFRGNFQQTKDELKNILSNLSDNNANDALELSLLMNTSPDDSSNLSAFASAELLAEQKKFGEAASKYKIVASDPKKFMLQNLAALREGEMELALNATDSAMAVFQKIADENEKNIYADKALYLVGRIYQYGISNKAKAVETYENLLAKFPNSLYLDEARAEINKLRGNKIDRME